jgi:hypothetical protein
VTLIRAIPLKQWVDKKWQSTSEKSEPKNEENYAKAQTLQ